jgi:hypothetical protein
MRKAPRCEFLDISLLSKMGGERPYKVDWLEQAVVYDVFSTLRVALDAVVWAIAQAQNVHNANARAQVVIDASGS